MGDEINRYRLLYNQQEVQIKQEPMYLETKNLYLLKTVIQIPTMSMDDPIRIQVGQPKPDKYQIIEIFIIQNPDFRDSTIMVSVFGGNDRVLNQQAEEIVESIQIECMP